MTTPTSNATSWNEYGKRLIRPFTTKLAGKNITHFSKEMVVAYILGPYFKSQADINNYTAIKQSLWSSLSLAKMFNPFKLIVSLSSLIQAGVNYTIDAITGLVTKNKKEADNASNSKNAKENLKAHPVAKGIKTFLNAPFALISFFSYPFASLEHIPPIAKLLNRKKKSEKVEFAVNHSTLAINKAMESYANSDITSKDLTSTVSMSAMSNDEIISLKAFQTMVTQPRRETLISSRYHSQLKLFSAMNGHSAAPVQPKKLVQPASHKKV